MFITLSIEAKTVYRFMTRNQTALKNHNLMTSNTPSRNAAHLKCLGATVTQKFYIKEKLRTE
jgi:hypothetical protein